MALKVQKTADFPLNVQERMTFSTEEVAIGMGLIFLTVFMLGQGYNKSMAIKMYSEFPGLLLV